MWRHERDRQNAGAVTILLCTMGIGLLAAAAYGLFASGMPAWVPMALSVGGMLALAAGVMMGFLLQGHGRR